VAFFSRKSHRANSREGYIHSGFALARFFARSPSLGRPMKLVPGCIRKLHGDAQDGARSPPLPFPKTQTRRPRWLLVGFPSGRNENWRRCDERAKQQLAIESIFRGMESEPAAGPRVNGGGNGLRNGGSRGMRRGWTEDDDFLAHASLLAGGSL
jgi:hypothetical protein